MRATLTLSTLLFALAPVGLAQEPREMVVVVTKADPARGEQPGIYVEYDLPPRGPARQDAPNGPSRAPVIRPHPALEALAAGELTLRAMVTFHEEIGGALGESGPAGPPGVLGVSLAFLDPVVEELTGTITSTRAGAVIDGAKPGRLEGPRSVLLLAVVQGRPVTVEGWRFSSGQPFLVSAIKGVVLPDAGRRARGLSDGYLSVPVREGGEYSYQKTRDVTAGEGLWVGQIKLHRRGDYTAPFRDLSELDLSMLDYDGKEEGGEDAEMDVLMAFTRPATDSYGKPVPSGFVPLRRLDLGAKEKQERLAAELTRLDTAAPEQSGLVQKVPAGQR